MDRIAFPARRPQQRIGPVPDPEPEFSFIGQFILHASPDLTLDHPKSLPAINPDQARRDGGSSYPSFVVLFRPRHTRPDRF
ncbi:hypothetical protein [Komagataeibacter intermedius]|uniref:hypothetical protein n=1 Tax=Komagataeibacter intermedius TaxID=66229 RepID=UPI003B42F12A